MKQLLLTLDSACGWANANYLNSIVPLQFALAQAWGNITERSVHFEGAGDGARLQCLAGDCKQTYGADGMLRQAEGTSLDRRYCTCVAQAVGTRALWRIIPRLPRVAEVIYAVPLPSQAKNCYYYSHGIFNGMLLHNWGSAEHGTARGVQLAIDPPQSPLKPGPGPLRDPSTGQTLLFAACMVALPHLVELLLRHGAVPVGLQGQPPTRAEHMLPSDAPPDARRAHSHFHHHFERMNQKNMLGASAASAASSASGHAALTGGISALAVAALRSATANAYSSRGSQREGTANEARLGARLRSKNSQLAFEMVLRARAQYHVRWVPDHVFVGKRQDVRQEVGALSRGQQATHELPASKPALAREASAALAFEAALAEPLTLDVLERFQDDALQLIVANQSGPPLLFVGSVDPSSQFLPEGLASSSQTSPSPAVQATGHRAIHAPGLLSAALVATGTAVPSILALCWCFVPRSTFRTLFLHRLSRVGRPRELQPPVKERWSARRGKQAARRLRDLAEDVAPNKTPSTDPPTALEWLATMTTRYRTSESARSALILVTAIAAGGIAIWLQCSGKAVGYEEESGTERGPNEAEVEAAEGTVKAMEAMETIHAVVNGSLYAIICVALLMIHLLGQDRRTNTSFASAATSATRADASSSTSAASAVSELEEAYSAEMGTNLWAAVVIGLPLVVAVREALMPYDMLFAVHLGGKETWRKGLVIFLLLGGVHASLTRSLSWKRVVYAWGSLALLTAHAVPSARLDEISALKACTEAAKAVGAFGVGIGLGFCFMWAAPAARAARAAQDSTATRAMAAAQAAAEAAAEAAAMAVVAEEKLSRLEQRQQRLSNSLECPITCERFKDPVLAPDGHTYERRAIETWLAKHGSSPLSGEPMPEGKMRPNFIVRGLLEPDESQDERQ